MDDLTNKRVTVAGLGRFGGGISVARWLCQRGATVLVTDLEPADKLTESIRQLAGLPIEFILGGHRESDFSNCDLVVTSPAIPPDNQYILAAKHSGVPVTTEIRLFIERCPCPIVAVTATKGKSTTTALLGKMLATRCTTWVGGNIGGSLLFDLPQIKADDIAVLELSSYMLEYLHDMRFAPRIALVGMITQDHLKWHGGLDRYIDAKRNIVRFQSPSDFAILNGENETTLSFAQHTPAKVSTYSHVSSPRFKMRLAGAHNQLNAQGAFAAARILGVTWDQAQKAIEDFGGLPHRLELVHEADGIQYVNDSIATIPEAAVAALDSFSPGHVIQIVGGYNKQLDMSSLCNALATRAKTVLCIGTLGKSICDSVQSTSDNPGKAEFCDTLEVAMRRARQLANTGDIVLLSTGCASFDQFPNFEKRGEAFTKLAREAGKSRTT
jgi:UDP-N-acetylmuramoylalanine--D-glutamate ligase